MALEERKIEAFAHPVKNLPDQPSQAGYTAAQLKEVFDSSSEELRIALNGLIDDLSGEVLKGLHTHDNKEALDVIKEVTQTLGNSADKVPSEAAVAAAMVKAGMGDMVAAVYDPQGRKTDIFAEMDSLEEDVRDALEDVQEVVGSVRGYNNATTVFGTDGSITETFADGVQVTTFHEDGSIVTVFTGADGKVMTKTITFNEDGSITEVVE